MNELIKVTTNENDEQLVSGRDLHEFLEVATEYKKWFSRMSEYGFSENQDFTRVTQKCHTPGGVQNITDHALKLDMAKEISMIQRSEKGKQARQYFISVEKRYKQQQLDTSNLSPELQMFQGLFTAVANQELATKRLESRVDNISDIVALNTTDWRKDSQKLIRRMAQNQGGFSAYQDVNSEIYEETERRAGANLKQRLTNKRRRMADEGASKSKRDKLNKLDVIADDKRLLEIYVAVVKEFAIRYGLDLDEIA